MTPRPTMHCPIHSTGWPQRGPARKNRAYECAGYSPDTSITSGTIAAKIAIKPDAIDTALPNHITDEEARE